MNLPEVAVVGTGEDRLICTVTFGDQPNERGTAFWALYDLTGKRLSYGHSKGRGGSGVSSVWTAMSNAKAAARRWLRRAR